MRSIVATALAAALLAAACADSTSTETPSTADGDHAAGMAAAGDTSRIVSLTGDVTEIIFELGLGDNVVAVDITTSHPDAAVELKKSGSSVGFAQALSAEAVLRFNPTLVIGDETVEPVQVIDQLKAAGVQVIIMPYRTSLDGVEAKILQVADLLGVSEKGVALAARVQADIAAAQANAAVAADPPRVAYLYTRGPSLIFVFGSGLPTNALIEGAGAIDVGAELGSGPIALTPEAIIATAPDVIVLPESGLPALGGIDGLLEIPGVADTPAGINRAFLSYEEAYFFNLGPRVGIALNEFIADLFQLVGEDR